MKIDDRVANELSKQVKGVILEKSDDAFSDGSVSGCLNVFRIQMDGKNSLLFVTDDISDADLENAVKMAIEEAI